MISIKLLLAATVLLAAAPCARADWFFMPSTYSHSPVTGERVTQYAPIPPVIVYQRPDYLRSGLRQQRSTIRAGGSLDVYNVVDQYGGTVRPYGEWLYPNRPYAVPYDQWGPPYGGVNGEYYGDAYLRGSTGGPHGRDGYGRGGYDYRDGKYGDRYRRGDQRIDARSREFGRYNGLFDGRGIPGDDEQYLDQPSRLDLMNDREFYDRPRGR